MERRKTRQIQLGNVKIGGGAPVAVQSMTNTHTDDAAATLAQINRLSEAGCDIVRCAVPDMAAAEGLKEIVKKSPLPVIADIVDMQIIVPQIIAVITTAVFILIHLLSLVCVWFAHREFIAIFYFFKCVISFKVIICIT